MKREVGVVEMTRNNEFYHGDVLAVSWSFWGPRCASCHVGGGPMTRLLVLKEHPLLFYYKHA